MHLSTITILAHVSLLLSLSFLADTEDVSPWLKNKNLDDDAYDDNDNDGDNIGFPKASCTGKQLFCHKDDGDGPAWKKKLMKCCKKRCVDTRSNVENCGFCGKTCPFPQQCCKGVCVDTNNSRFNCGNCGNKCRFRVRCVYGMCGYGQPDPGWPPKGHWNPPPVDRRSSSFV